MRVLPILFNGDMVRAILDGRKTCTRRVIKPQWEECPHCKYVHNEYIYDKMAENVYCARCGYPLEPERRSPYQLEDILYVRETWGHPISLNSDKQYVFRADKIAESGFKNDSHIWHPSIHMPKEAARIWLQVTDVWVERLQDITPKDAENEGVGNLFYEDIGYSGKDYGTEIDSEYGIAKEQFAWLWDSTIKKADLDCYGWNANPWVWVIEFERCEKPEES